MPLRSSMALGSPRAETAISHGVDKRTELVGYASDCGFA